MKDKPSLSGLQYPFRPLLLSALGVGMLSLVTTVSLERGFHPLTAQAQSPDGPLQPLTQSNAAQIALASYLQRIGATMYGSFRCPHCQNQKELFGQQAAAKLHYIECHPEGRNSQTQRCIDAQIRVVPTWVINGQRHEGTLSLEQLADLSGYKGSREFQASTP